jgi:acyl-[acyl-carrier-protein]-phospholipid O-acyltransferase / long-chain-fatty-acid--[acyl-carrier-protein] ligase
MDHHGYASLLRYPGYREVLVSQSLGALNDNVLRIVVSLYAISPAIDAADRSMWIALCGIAFIAPFLFFAGHAGRLSDTYEKRSVMIGAKIAELLIVSAALLAFAFESLPAMIVVLFLMAMQSAYFSPARYGILPELVGPAALGLANGLGEMAMYVAIVIGMGLGGFLLDIGNGGVVPIGAAIIGIAGLGLAAALQVPTSSVTDGSGRCKDNAAAAPAVRDGLRHGLRLLRRSPALAAGVAGMSLFWFYGALLQVDVLFFATELLRLNQTGVGLMQGTLGLGVAAGALVAGSMICRIAALRLLQGGGVLLAAALALLATGEAGRPAAFMGLFTAGCGGGLFIVPVVTYLQACCEPAVRGRLFAVNNFCNMIGVLVGVGTFWFLNSLAGLSASAILRILAVAVTSTFAAMFLITSIRERRRHALTGAPNFPREERAP